VTIAARISGLVPGRIRRLVQPLFIQIFLTMLVCVLLVQFVNILVVVAMPRPMPEVFTLADIRTALVTGRDPTGRLDVARSGTVDFDTSGGRAQHMRSALAREIGVAPEAIRMSWHMPMRLGPRPPLPAPYAQGRGAPGWRDDFRPDLVIGRFSVAMRQADGSWRIATSSHGLDPFQLRLLIWLLAALVLVTPFAWLLARRIAAPIGAFAAAAERLGKDPRPRALTLHGPREVEAASLAFNEMQNRLGRYVEDRTAMMGAIAHDLRTPLMRLSFRLENAPEDLRRKAEADIREMKEMLSAVLGFVRDMSQTSPRQKLDLRALIESIADNMTDMGDDVVVEDGAALVMEGDSLGLRRLFGNLLSNAVKYGRRARVKIVGDQKMVMVDIADDGPGLPDDALEQVFEPFYRLEPSRNRNTGGAGIGLATVRTIARAHGGDATLRNDPAGGLVAQVTLPI